MPKQVTPTFSSSMVGRTGTTNHGERVVIVGPANDPARVTVRPEGGDPSVVETFTPKVSNVTMDANAPSVAQDARPTHGRR